MKARGKKGSEAELLFKKWLESEGWTVHRAARAGFVQRGGLSFCQSHDLFGCFDMLAFRKGDTWCVQVTTQNGRTARRRKIEAIEWAHPWTVSIVSHEATPDPAHRGRRMHFWRREDMRRGMDGRPIWLEPLAIAFDPKVVEAHAKARRNTPADGNRGKA